LLAVQAQTGIPTSLLLQNWIGEVLKRVVEQTRRRGDPLLAPCQAEQRGVVI
jgi:hypothetical protein